MSVFTDAYKAGLERYNSHRQPWMTEIISHFLPKDHGGNHYDFSAAAGEAFAELFATQLSDWEYCPPLRTIFREAVEAVKTIIEAVEFEMTLPADPADVIRRGPG